MDSILTTHIAADYQLYTEPAITLLNHLNQLLITFTNIISTVYDTTAGAITLADTLQYSPSA